MDLKWTEVQRMLRQSVRDLLENQDTISILRDQRKAEASGHSEKLWNAMADLGLLGLPFPEALDGEEGSLTDLGVVYEETGRALIPTTFYSTMTAGLLIDSLGTSEQKQQYLPELARGNMISTLAYSESDAIHDPRYFRTRAKREGNQWSLSGEKIFVLNGQLSDPLFVAAGTDRGTSSRRLTVFIVDPAREGVSFESQETFAKDNQSRVTFEDVTLDDDAVLGGPEATGEALSLLNNVLSKARALQCMEMVGGAQRVLEMTVDYMKEREQFGRPLGTFQAVQHHCANMALQLKGARLSSYQALSLIENDEPASRELSIAKAWTGKAYKKITVMAHQLFGGIGYVKEHDLHLWSERAKATEILYGTYDYHQRNIADEIGL